MSLMTKAEIITRVFTRSVSESRIPDDIVSSCETKYIKPVLGEDFYNAVVLAPGSYTTLLTYIKPALAWWVRYMILPELRIELSDLGVTTIQIKEGAPVDNDLFAQIRDNTRIVAEEKEKLLNDYLGDNASSYPLYYPSADPLNQVRIAGGIIMNQMPEKTWPEEEDSAEKWRQKL